MSSLPPLSAAHASRLQVADPKASSPDGHSSASSNSPSSDPSSASLSPPSSSNRSANDGDDDDDDTTAVPLVRWTKKPRRKRTGWGPYQSVLNERSVDFNLTLDVQNLKQEIQQMQTYYDLLASKTLIQRHDPGGSLVRIAHEHYRIFRTGFNLRQTGRKRLMDEKDQKEFLYSIFDDEVECGVGADGEIQRGIDIMVQQIMLYTVFIKAIAMTLTSFEVILADDTVIVATKGILHFQILRNTIAGMFPHVLGEEWLMSKLVGQEVAPETAMNFYFNKQNKVTKFAVELDYVKTFAGVLSSPEEVDILLGRALITEDCLIIPNNEEEDKAPPPGDVASSPSGSNSTKNSSDADSGNGSGVDGDAEDLSATSSGSSAEDSDHSHGKRSDSSTSASTKYPASTKSKASAKPSPTSSSAGSQSEQGSGSPPTTAPVVSRGPMTPVDHFNSVVQSYFRLFAQGCHASTEASAAEFLTKYFSPTVQYGDAVGRQVLHDRWRSLSWCFDVLSFRQVAQGDQWPPVAVYEPQKNRYRIETRAEYALQLTVRTLELVFPHVVSDLALTDVLVGSRIVVSSDLSFWLERGTGLLAKVSERMAFEDAFKQMVKDPEDLAFVLQGAQPILTSFVGRITSVASPSQEGQLKARATRDESESEESMSPSSPNDSQSSETEAKMRLSAILGAATPTEVKKQAIRAKEARKQKAGWELYRTVVKECAVAFNLTLDVQQLQQEVHSLAVARAILVEARAVNQCHAPSGSLVCTVEKYYDMLRTGFNIEPVDAARRHVHAAHEQCEFLRSIMNPKIDCGIGLFGVDVMIEQIQLYSIFLRFIRLQLHLSGIVNAADSLMITTKGTIHFQILRDTIADIFPHIIGQE